MLDLTSLPQTIDSLNETLFYAQPISPAEKEQAAQFLLSRQIRNGNLTGLFTPSKRELETGILLFTGERLRTHLGPRNIFSSEIGRACLLLGLATPGLNEALERLQEKLLASCFAANLCIVGECAHSGVGFMRYLAAGGAPDAGKRLDAHLRLLAHNRDGKGGWVRFPFHYTLLALTGMDLPAAVAEMRYAAAARENIRQRACALDEKYITRRQLIWERLLASC